MKQLVEVRFNGVEFPQKDKPNVKGQELIFVASRIGYQAGLNGTLSQVAETEVWRCMATEHSIAVAAATLLHLLPAELRAKVLESFEDSEPD